MTEPVVAPIVPAYSLASAPFWGGGADGELRIEHCTSCAGYFHPPGPMCPHCHSTEVELAVVSGRATVAAVTVNEHPWHPAFPPPYVVAIVALEEDDRARLTTNIIGCPVEDVVIGVQVQVTFKQVSDEVWLPLFEPIPGAGPGPVPEPRDVRKALRTMASPDKYEDKVALTGVGLSRIGRRLMVNPLDLTLEACTRAVEDAGLTFADIDGLCSYPGGNMAGMSEGGIMPVEETLNIRPVWVNAGGDMPGQNGSIMGAMLAVAAGLCRHVLCFRTLWQASETALFRSGQLLPSTDRPHGMLEYRMPFGAMSAANWIGMHASHYLHRYGATREMLGEIAINARTMAAHNPDAIYREPMSMDDYLSARMVSTPFGLYDCDTPIDGAIAVIVSRKDAANDGPNAPIFVEACGTQVLERLSWDQDTLTHMPQALGPGAHLWTRTDLRPQDVDVAEIYDGFTFNTVSWLEAMGFCGIGEAKDFLAGGKNIGLDGILPLNTHGGQLSAGRTHGYGFVHEAVLQLRGQAGSRQVKDAKVAAVAAGGGTPAGCMLLRSS
ncbi:MAG: hypothetical protein JWL64_2838 [Frankiales bacterium]|nr:hypothetical protein [Frankiales bacterium]